MSELEQTEMPRYYFIDIEKLPVDLMDHNPLAASLQTLETALILLVHGRFPAALIMIASAIESVNKAKLLLPQTDTTKPGELYRLVKGHYKLKRDDWSDWEYNYTLFCDRRNRFIHFGYTPECSENCAELLLKTGFPLLSNLYEALFDIHLSSPKKRSKAVFYPKIAEMWEAAKQIYLLETKEDNPGFGYALYPLSKYISYLMHDDGNDGSQNFLEYRYDKIKYLREEIEKRFSYPEAFKCPICDSEEFIADLSHDGLDEKKIVLDEGKCPDCEFSVSYQQRLIFDVLMGDQVRKKSPAILNEYGIK